MKKLNKNNTRMLPAVLSKWRKQHTTKQQYAATYLSSHEGSKYDKQDILDTALEAVFSCGLVHMDTPVKRIYVKQNKRDTWAIKFLCLRLFSRGWVVESQFSVWVS